MRKGVRDVALGDLEMLLTGPNLLAGKAWIRKNEEAKVEMVLNMRCGRSWRGFTVQWGLL